MQLKERAARLKEGAAQVQKRFFKLEQVVAYVSLLTPALLWLFDGRNARDSISAYYDMTANAWFYFLFAAAAMLFIVNGVIKDRHWYNIVLGVALAGVLLANTDDYTELHALTAGAFFLGNGAVVLVSVRSWTWRGIILAGILVPLFAVLFGWWSLFVGEWISLGFITGHYLADAAKTIPYHAYGSSAREGTAAVGQS